MSDGQARVDALIKDIRNPPKPPEVEKVTLFNPSKHDFSHAFDGSPYSIPAGEAATFAAPVAAHLKKHLKTFLISQGNVTGADKIERIEKEITVELEG